MEECGEQPPWSEVVPQSATTKPYWSQGQSLRLREGLLYHVWVSPTGNKEVLQLVLSKTLRKEAIRQLHDTPTSGHFAANKTLSCVREQLYWVGCGKDVTRYCQCYDLCASWKGPAQKQHRPMKQYNVGAPMERIAMDVLGPLPLSHRGNKYLLIVADYFTKWPEAYPIPNQEAVTVATVLVEEFFCRFGMPLEIHSDQDPNFESQVFQEVCKLLQINKTRTTPFHPQSDGMVERMNRTLEAQLAIFVEEHQQDWDNYIPLLIMAYCSAVHDTTKCTPTEMMLGRNLRVPADLMFSLPPADGECSPIQYGSNLQDHMEQVHNFARSHTQLASDRMKKHYDTKAVKTLFHRGDFVWLYNPRRRKGITPKLCCPWEGPYLVMKRINDVVY